jgi:hypothetical protein
VAAEREAAARKRERLERQAVERDQLFRARLSRGIPAAEIPTGLTGAEAMIAANEDGRPRRESVLEHALANSGQPIYHPIEEDAGWVVGGGDGS